MTTPPSFRKVNPGDFPVLFISLRSPTLPLSTVNEYAETVLAQQISQIPGVAQVLVYGAQKFAVRVQVDPVGGRGAQHLARRHPHAVHRRDQFQRAGRHAVRAAAERHAAGDRRDDARPTTTARSSSPTATARRSSSSEIARVIDSVENDKIASWFNDERAIVLAIQRQPDANTVEVVDAVRERLPAFRAQVPAAIEMEVADRPLDLDPRRRSPTCRRRW